MSNPVTAYFTLEKVTKNAARYAEIDKKSRKPKEKGDGAVIGTVYLLKTLFEGDTPTTDVELTVTPVAG